MKQYNMRSKSMKLGSIGVTRKHHILNDFSDQISGIIKEMLMLTGTTAGAFALLSALSASPSHALPQNGAVVGGSATVSQPNTTTLNINQTSGNAIINWQGFNIGANESVKYIQPSNSSIALNRVTGVDPTYIYGLLSGNGQVWVINPNGLLVGPGATVQTGSFLASTMNITNDNFMSGKYMLSNTPNSQATIVNQGNIQAANGGYVMLVAPSVTNSGSIVANMGTVHLASGDAVTLSINGGNLINVAVSGDVAANALGVTNTGHITADGGQVVMTARVGGDILKNVVNNEGIIEAKSIIEKNGLIILDGGDHGITANGGTLDASGRNIGETGGTVKMLGDKVGLFAGSMIDVSGYAGGGTALIGGNLHGAGPEKNATMTYVDKDASIKADALVSGDGGKVVVWSDDATRFYGAVSAQGGSNSGNGGFVETSGKQFLDFQGSVSTLAPAGKAGTLLLDPSDITITTAASSGTMSTSSPFQDGTITTSNLQDTVLTGALAGGSVLVDATVVGGGSGSGNITVSTPITWANTNLLTLTASNNISVNNAINGGALTLNAGSAISQTGVITTTGALTLNAVTMSLGAINTGGLLTINNSGAATQTGVISGSGGLTKAGAGTLSLSQTNAYSGATSITAGTLNANTSSALGDESATNTLIFTGGTLVASGNITSPSTRPLTLTNTAIIDTNGNNLSIAGTISGAGGLTKNGSGTLTLSGIANSYSGQTLLNTGTLAVTTNSALGSTAAGTTVAGTATLDLQGVLYSTTESITLLSGAILATSSGTSSLSGNVTLTGTNTVSVNGTQITLAGAVGGTGASMTKTGTGILVMTGINNYSGSTSISAGILNAISSSALGDGSSTNSLILTGGTLQAGGTITSPSTRTVTLTGTGIIDTNGNNVSIAGKISGGGLTKTGSGTLTLSNSNNYTGTTTVTDGTLSVANPGALNSASSLVVNSVGTLDINNVTLNTLTSVQIQGIGSGVGALTGTGASAIYNGPITLTGATTVGGSGSLRLGGIISGAQSLTKADSGTLTLGTPLATTVSVAVTNGTLDLGNQIDTVAGLRLTGGTIQDGTITSASTYDLQAGTVSVKLFGTVGLNKTTSGTLTLSGANNYSGATAITAGILNVNSSSALGDGSVTNNLALAGGVLQAGNDITSPSSRPLTLSGSTSQIDTNGHIVTIAGTISGASGSDLTKNGSGTLILSGIVNSYTGLTSVLQGTLQVTTDSAMGSNASGTTVATGATLDLRSVAYSTTEAITLQGGATLAASNGTSSLAGSVTLAGANTVSVDGAQITLAGSIGGTGGSLTKTGFGTLIMTGNNNYSGSTTISAGILNANSSSALGDGSITNSLIFTGGTLQAGGSFTSPITRPVTLTSPGIIVTNSYALTIDAVISGGGGLTKQGPGTLTLNNTNSYTGGTSITGGTLTVGTTNAINSANAVTVSGGTLDLAANNDTVTSVSLQNGSITGTTGILTSATAFDLRNGTVSAILGGTAGANKTTTAGTVTLSGSNTYTGSTTVSAGTLTLGSTNALASTSTLVVSGGVFDLGSYSNIVAGVQQTGGTIQNGTLTSTAPYDMQSGLTSAILAGGVGLNKTSVNTVTLSGANLYTGPTSITGGTLIVGASNTINIASAVTVNGGTLNMAHDDTVGSVSLHSGSITGGSTGTLTSTAAFDLKSGTVSAVLGGTAGANKTSDGTSTGGTVTLSGANTYTGATTVSGGTLALGNSNILANNSTLVVSGGTFDLVGHSNTVAGVQQTGGTIVTTQTGGTLTSTTPYDMQAGVTSAILAGAVGLNKTTSGTVTLSGANTYLGPTSITGGTLAVGAANSINILSAVTVNGGTLLMSANDSVASVSLQGGTIAGSSILTSTTPFDLRNGTVSAVLGGILVGANKTSDGTNSGGTVTLSGANTYTGTTTVSAGTLTLGSSNVLASAGTLIVSGGTLDMGSNNNIMASVSLQNGGIITGSGKLTSTSSFDLQNGSVSAVLAGSTVAIGANKTTTGTVTLLGLNTYTGATTISAGTLTLGNSNTLASGSTLVVNGSSATLDMSSHSNTVASASLQNNGSIIGTGTLTSTAAFDLQSGSVSAVLGGSTVAIGANKTTTGTVTLNGTNTYKGATTVSAGTLLLGNSDALASSSTLVVSGGVFDLGGNSNTLAGVQQTGGTIQGGRLTSTTAYDVQNGTVNAILAGSVGLNKTTTGTVTLNGANLYTGPTNITNGTLIVGASNTINSSSVLTVSGGTLNMGANNDAVVSVSLQNSGSIIGTGTLTSAATFDLQSGTVNAVLDGTSGANKTTAGTVTLSGANTYTGTTTVTLGTLALGNSNTLASKSTLVVSGGTFDLGSHSNTVAGVQMTGGTIQNGTLTSMTSYDMQAGTTTTSAILAGATLAVGLNKTNSGTVTLSGANTYSGLTSITGGTLSVGASNTISTLNAVTVNGGTLAMGANNDTVASVTMQNGSITGTTGILTSATAFDLQNGTVSAVLGGNSGANKTNIGTVTLSGINTYTGATTVSAGTLTLGNTKALMSTSSLIVSGGVFDLGALSSSVAGVQQTGGTIQNGTLASTTAYDMQAGATTAILAGAVGLNKTSAGTVTLSGANSYTGATLITGGTLKVTVNGALGTTAGGTTVSNGAILALDGSSGTGGGINYSTAEPVTLNGGTLSNVAGNNSFAGAVTLGTESAINSTAATLTLTGGVNNGGFLTTFSGAGNTTINTAKITGTGGLTKTGVGTLTLNTTNDYTGGTNIQAGTLQLSVVNAIANTGAVELADSASAVLNLNGTNATIGSLAGGGHLGGNVTLGAGTLTVGNNTSTIFGGVISGAGGLIKQGTGMLTLTNTNNYTGATTVNTGTLTVTANSALGSAASGITVTNGATLAFDGSGGNIIYSTADPVNLNGGTLSNLAGTNSFAGTVTLSAPSVIDSTTGTLTLTGGIATGTTTPFNVTFSGTGNTTVSTTKITGSGSLTKVGSGTLLLSAINDYTGVTTVNGGTLQLSGGTAIPGAVVLALAPGAAVLDLNGTNVTIGSLSGGGSVTLGTGTLTVVNATNTSFGGVISGAGGLIKQGAGTLTLTNTNTYDGSTAVNAGTLTVTTNGGLGSAVGGTTIASGATLAVDGSGGTGGGITYSTAEPVILNGGTLNNVAGANSFAGPMTLSAASSINSTAGTLTLTGGIATGTIAPFNVTFSGVGNTTVSSTKITGNGGLIKTGTGTLILSAANDYTGVTTINAGTLQLSGGSTIGAIVLANAAGTVLDLHGTNETISSLSGGGTTGGNVTLGIGTLTVGDATNTSFGGVISGAGGLIKQGTSTLTLTNTNTYDGSTEVNAGTLKVTAVGGLGSGVGGTTVASGSILAFDGSGGNIIYSIAEPVTLNGGTLSNVAGANIFVGAVTLSAPSTIGSTSGTLTLTGGINNGGFLATFSGIGNTAVSSTKITGSGSLTKNGTGTLLLSAANDFTGVTTINAGTLQLSGGSAVPGALVLANAAGAVLDLHGTNETISSLSGGGAIGGNISLGIGTLTVGDATNSSFGGVISGAGGLIKQGTGTLTLTNTNTYDGSTAVNAGTLKVTAVGGLGSGVGGTTVASGAILALDGSGGAGGGINYSTAEAVMLNGGTFNSVNGANIFAGTVTVGSGTGTINLSDGSLTLSGAVEGSVGGGGLVVAGSGTLSLASPVGKATPIGGLTVVNGVKVNVNGSIVNTSGSQAYHDDVTIGSANAVLTTANSSVTFDKSVTLNNDLTILSGTGGVTVTGAVDGPSNLNLSNSGLTTITSTVGHTTNLLSVRIGAGTAGSTVINGGEVSTSGDQTYNNAVTIATDTKLTSTGSGSITVASTLNGSHALTLTTSGTGNVIINGAVGGNTPLSTITGISGSNIAINNAVNSSGPITFTAGQAITEGNAGALVTTGLLTTKSTSGQNLAGNGKNSVSFFNANNSITSSNAKSAGSTINTNSSSGDIILTNTTPLTITGVYQAGGNLILTNTAAITSTGSLTVAGASTITATGQPITLTNTNNDFTGAVTATGAATQIFDKNDLTVVLNTTGPTTVDAGGNMSLSGSSTGSVIATAANKVTLSDPAASILTITGNTIVGTMNNPTPLDLTTTSNQIGITVALTGSLPFLTFAPDINSNVKYLGTYNGGVVIGNDLEFHNTTIDLRALVNSSTAIKEGKLVNMLLEANYAGFFTPLTLESLIDIQRTFNVPQTAPKLIDK